MGAFRTADSGVSRQRTPALDQGAGRGRTGVDAWLDEVRRRDRSRPWHDDIWDVGAARGSAARIRIYDGARDDPGSHASGNRVKDMTMRIAVAGDHAGLSIKNVVRELLSTVGHEVHDLGTFTSDPVDYPDCAALVARAIIDGVCERGVLVCGSGVGASVAANKHRGIRAGLCHDTYSAHQGVEHDDMNVLVLGGRVIGEALARELVLAFVTAGFTNEERHCRRLEKVRALEEVVCH